MARVTPRIDVAVKAGRNRPVKNVIKLETLMRHFSAAAPAAAKKPRGLRTAARGQSAEARQLAADLEKQVRAMRRAVPESTARAKSSR